MFRNKQKICPLNSMMSVEDIQTGTVRQYTVRLGTGGFVRIMAFIRGNFLVIMAVTLFLVGTWYIGGFVEQRVSRLMSFSLQPFVLMEIQFVAVQSVGMLLVLCTISFLCVTLNRYINF